MVDWITIPNFVDDKVQRARTFQNIASNLDLIKNPMLVATPGPAIAGGAWTFSSTGSWADIDTIYYNNAFTSQGNAILAIAILRFSHSAANGVGAFRFMLDGVARGNSKGQFGCADISNIQETFCFADVLESVSAGDHTLKLQVINVTVGNTEVWKDYGCLALRTFEF
jgi:hypothetical protein